MGRSLAVVRRATPSRCVAALLALMVFLPFTPPYSTCGLSDLIGEVATDHAPAFESKVIDVVAAAVPSVGAAAALILNTSLPPFAVAALPSPRPVQSEVQRI